MKRDVGPTCTFEYGAGCSLNKIGARLNFLDPWILYEVRDVALSVVYLVFNRFMKIIRPSYLVPTSGVRVKIGLTPDIANQRPQD